jgi:hypothetical protein
MKKLTRTTAALGAAGLVAAALAAATPANAAGSIFEIKVTEVTTSQHDNFTGDPGVGDSFSFTSNLRQDGQRVGTDAGTCTFKQIFGSTSNPTGARVRCVVNLHFFNKGTIRVAGRTHIDFAKAHQDFTIPVTGGSGNYRGVGGTVHVHEVTDTKSRLTIDLTNYHP